MFKNGIDSSRILKGTHTILNSLKDTLRNNINNKKLYEYIINQINNIKIDFINISQYNLEIGNKDETFQIHIISEFEDNKEVKINYIKRDFSETKQLKINNDVAELNESRITNTTDYKIHTSLIKNYRNKILNKIKYTKIDFIKDCSEEFEVYVDDNIIFGKKINKNKLCDTKEEYYYCDFKYSIKFSNLDDKTKSISSEFLEDFIFLYLENFNSTKEKFDAALENLKKEQETKLLTKRNNKNGNNI